LCVRVQVFDGAADADVRPVASTSLQRLGLRGRTMPKPISQVKGPVNRKLLMIAGDATPKGRSHATHVLVQGGPIRPYFTSSQEARMPESDYQREESVEPARIASFAALRQRFKRGEQLMTEESRMLDLYELTSRRIRSTHLSPRSVAFSSSPSAGGPDDQE
jgi:hypothetical protein